MVAETVADDLTGIRPPDGYRRTSLNIDPSDAKSYPVSWLNRWLNQRPGD
jgi:hypothetical protein